ncbi:MAG: PIN domain-containing protein [Deltaproteobacteria bacterium]|nr:PIN domain-containing protein [Deltaproteobacteria bacterium]
MRFLLDTDAVSEPARRHPSRRFMARLAKYAGELAVSSISVGEIVFGARRAPGGQRYLHYLTETVLPHVAVLPIDVAVATRYGELRAVLERGGTPLADLDLLIAATALAHDLALVTGNRRHFERIGGLDLADWFADRAAR